MKKEKESYNPEKIHKKGSNPIHSCVCPNCGYEMPKNKGLPCSEMSCPICETKLVAK
ncbi:MAG: hypothetical protein KGY67_00980 [Candidatus Thermoplasmatota archaeon]|nr:hypothetical protein [Candidatus Thermoplasmatota archaeon]